jgi:OmpA-OmpF porin, OOP family
MKRIGSTTLALTLVMAAATVGTTALAGAPEGSWYVSPQVNGVWLDDSRTADDHGGVTLAFGRTMSTNWDAQISLFNSSHDRGGGDDLEIQGFGFNLNRVFYREGRVNPFLTFGLGRVKSILKPGADQSNLSALYGAGILIDLGGPRDDGSQFQLRGDLGARRGLSSHDDADKTVDYVAGLGLQYSWGGKPVRKVVDSDGDGVLDDTDQCPGTPAGTPVDAKGCPLPQDDDGDALPRARRWTPPVARSTATPMASLTVAINARTPRRARRWTTRVASSTPTRTGWSTAPTSVPTRRKATGSTR